MRFTPRAEEVDRVVAVMETEGYTAEEMAKEIIKQVVDMLHFRDWYIVGSAGRALNWGPWASKADAESFRTKYAGILIPTELEKSGVVWVRPIGSQDDLERREGGGFGFCHSPDCGHPQYAHRFAGTSRGECVVCHRRNGEQSPCQKYLAEEPAKKKSKAKKSKEGSS